MIDTTVSATVADVVARLTGTSYDWTAVATMGWGMGSAQLGISRAVQEAEDAGLVVTKTHNGKRFAQLAPLYTLTYETSQGVQVRDGRPARAVETIGRIVSRAADRGEAWDIAVRDANGNDVTDRFTCFSD